MDNIVEDDTVELCLVPDKQLEENLKLNGNPVDWIRLCEECCQLSRKALELHCQVIKVDRELWKVQKLIVEKTKSSNLSLPEERQGRQLNIWEWTRAFVKKANCQSGSLPVNPFIEGDKLATANYYFRKDLNSHQDLDNLRNDHDGKNSLQIKSEQFTSQSISDNEGDDDNWQLDHDEDDDNEVNSDDDNRKSLHKKPNHPERKRVNINGKIKCNFCSKSFYTSSGCTKHENEKHPSVPNQYPCTICGIAWNSGVYLQKHMLRKHNVRLSFSQLTKLKSTKANTKNDENSEDCPTPTVKVEPLNSDETCDASDFEEAGNFKSEDDDVDWKLNNQNDEDEDLSDEDKAQDVKSTEKRGRGRKRTRLRVNGKIKCTYCDKVFARLHGCYRHEKELHPRTPAQFSCDICGKCWNSREYLNRHRKEVHPSIPNQYLCKFCGQAWNSRGYLRKHVERMHKNGRVAIKVPPPKRIRLRVNGKVKCYFCEKLFAKVSGCARHENEKHVDIPAQFPCQICGRAWNSREYLMGHMRKVHKGANHSADEIIKSDVVANLGNEKEEKNQGGADLVDKDDDKVLKKISRVAADKVSVTRARKKIRMKINGKIKCNYCDKLFAGISGCYMHEKEKHGKNLVQFRCEICDKVWNSRQYLLKHLTRGHGIKSAEKMDFMIEIQGNSDNREIIGEDSELCEISTGNTSEEELLDNDQFERDGTSICTAAVEHELGQDDDKNDGDDKVEFEDVDELQFDDVRSAGEDEDKDDVEEKMREAMGVVLKKSIDKLRYSSRDKPFSCKLCDKKFTDRFGLGRHERSHKNEKRREQRNESSKKTESRQQRGSRKLEGMDGKFKCGKCDKQFTSAGSLRNHETNHKFKEIISQTDGDDVTVPTPNVQFPVKRKRIFAWVDGKLKCGSCDKEFPTEKRLVKHEKEIHKSEEGDLICELCGKVFTNLHKLRNHKKRVHMLKADGSPFVPRNYKLKKADREEYGLPAKNGKGKRGINYLNVGGKLKCNSCDRLFISADGLYKHEKEKHPKKPGEIICTHCGMTFNSLPYLRIHTERKHWLRMNGDEKIPSWVPTRKYKWKKSEK